PLFPYTTLFRSIVPVLSLYALAGYRLLPSLQKLFDTFSSVRFNYPIIDAIYEDLRMEDEIDQSERERDDAEPLEFTSGIHIDDVSFRYPSSDDYVLRKISATIRKNTHVAFRSEEHTSELQSRENVVCRFLHI